MYIYVLEFILHDWDDEKSVTILKNIAHNMQTTSRILLVEYVLSDKATKDFGLLYDLQMLIQTSGRGSTREEYKSLFAQARRTFSKIYNMENNLKIIKGKL